MPGHAVGKGQLGSALTGPVIIVVVIVIIVDIVIITMIILWLLTNGVSTNGAAAKVTNSAGLEKGTPWYVWESEVNRRISVKKHDICSDPIRQTPTIFLMATPLHAIFDGPHANRTCCAFRASWSQRSHSCHILPF